MKVACPSCNANLNIDDKKIPAGGARIKCPTCQQVFPVKPSAAAATMVGAIPLPGQTAAPRPLAPQGPVPLPGLTAADAAMPSWEEESTRVMPQEMIPGALTAAAPPSNVNTATMPAIAPAVRPGSIPLPGKVSAPVRAAAVPLPGISAAKPQKTEWEDEKTRVGGEEAPPAEPQSFDFDPAATTAAAVPLPGNYEPTRMGPAPVLNSAEGPIPLPGALGGEVDFASDPDPGEATTGAIPLPGNYQHTAISQLPLGDDAVPVPGASSYEPTGQHPAYQAQSLTGEDLPPPPGAFDFSAPAPSMTVPGAGGFDFSDLPSPKGVSPRASPAAPSYEDLPAPRAAAIAPPPPDYSDLPAPAAPHDPFESPDFGSDLPSPAMADLPSPANDPAEFSFDMAAPPPPSRAPAPPPPMAPPPPAAAPQAAAPGFGEVEFDGGGGGGGGGGGDLEFDPTSAPKADDLEADLSAPPVASKPATSGDGLEMLSFIDQTAKEAGAREGGAKARRFHIRRRSGKVFGPFEDAVIIKMLEDGQLLGNEEVSIDSDQWTPIGSEPTFQTAIARLMDAPSKSATTTNLAQVQEHSQAQQAASMDRLKNLYEGRMAAVAVVQGKEPVPFARRLPYLIAVVILLAIGGTGAYLGTTPYGLFGLKVLFPAKIKAGGREFAELQTAQKALLSDTFKGYQQARDTAQSTLRVKEYPEARAIWCQAIFYLSRKYAAAPPADVAQAVAELDNIELLGGKHPEVVKARVGNALMGKSPDTALTLLGDALARSENADDVELAFLRAEAFVLKGQLPQAFSELEAILKKKPDSARALHALGNLHQSQKEADKAADRYEQALKADPEHASSAVELSAIELLIRHDISKGRQAIEQALGEARRDKLGPAELGKALALKAETLAMEHKLDEAIPLFEEALAADKGNSFTKARLASAYVAQHDQAKALPLFKAATEASPEKLEYAEAYLASLIELGKMQDATAVVTATNARFPGNARLTYIGARVDDALDRIKEAEAGYLKAAAADPTLVDANLYLARLYVRFRRIGDAKPQLEEALKKAPDNAEVRVVLGEVALSENNTERAEAELKRALELNSTLAAAYVGLCRLELIKGHPELALANAEKALKLNPLVFGGRVQRGTSLWKLGRLDEAVSELEAARLDEPRNTSIVVTLGAVQLEKRDLNGATGTLMAALSSEPSNPEANFYLAKVKNLKAEHTGAIEAMKRALEMQPKRAEFRFWMGKIFLDAKKTPEAIDEWKLALDNDPKYVDALEALGHVYLDRNDVKKAVKYFQGALDSDPNRTAAQAAIGDAYSQAEEWPEAISTYEKAIKADPNLKQVYFRLGQAYNETKKYDQAITLYKKASVVEPENANVWLALGYAYKERKQRGEAATAFKRYLTQKPDADNKKEIEDEIDYLK